MVLDTLSMTARERLVALGQRRTFAGREVILRRGDPGTSLIVLQSGRAEISVTTSLGRKSILAVAGPGEIIGDIACLDGGPRSADVVAAGPVDAVVIERREVLRVLREDPDSAVAVIEALCRKARNASDMFELLSMTNSAARLAGCILRLMGDPGEPGYDGTLRVAQGWLGDYAGLSRENVNRHLTAWRRDGITGFHDGVLAVLDRGRLEDIALDGATPAASAPGAG